MKRKASKPRLTGNPQSSASANSTPCTSRHLLHPSRERQHHDVSTQLNPNSTPRRHLHQDDISPNLPIKVPVPPEQVHNHHINPAPTLPSPRTDLSKKLGWLHAALSTVERKLAYAPIGRDAPQNSLPSSKKLDVLRKKKRDE